MLARSLMGIAGLLLLAACAGRHDTVGAAPPTVAAVPPTVAAVPPTVAAARPSGAAARPTGVILLARESEPMQHEPRNIVVCEEYLAQVAKEGQGEDAPSTRRDIRAVWLYKRRAPTTPANCEEALDNYDFDRAARVIRQIRPPVTGSGPFLVAYFHREPRLIVDGATADTDEKLRAAVARYLDSAGDPAADLAAAEAAGGVAAPLQKRSLCDRMGSVNLSGGSGRGGIGVVLAEVAGVLVVEAVICIISAAHEGPPA